MISENSHNPEVVLRQQQWEQAVKEVRELKDDNGTPIEPGVEETLVASKVMGFNTVQSCEGHPVPEHGEENYPWVQISLDEPDDIQQDQTVKKEFVQRNLQKRSEMQNLINEFYQTNPPAEDAHLVIVDQGLYGGFRVQSIGAENLHSLPPDVIKAKHQLYLEELQVFTQFLKDKYFEI